MISSNEAVHRLGAAFRRHDLTLFVGAGASVASSLPTWRDLLAGVFVNSLGSLRASEVPILQASAEAWFHARDVALDVFARELRASFADADEFMKWVRFALYKWTEFNPSGTPSRQFIDSLRRNKTLSAIARMCRATRPGKAGLRRVVSYNYDDLLELRLGRHAHQTLWTGAKTRPAVLPIYHVHGFLPARFPWTPYRKGAASLPEEIVLTEDQYHREAAEPFRWSNLVQLQAATDSVGVTVGLSMTDPNMRRILDISAKSATRPEIYALMPRPRPTPPDDLEVDRIVDGTNRLLRRGHPWLGNGIDQEVVRSKPFVRRAQAIWKQLDDLALARQVKVMNELGVYPLWCDRDEIPAIIDRIIRRRALRSRQTRPLPREMTPAAAHR